MLQSQKENGQDNWLVRNPGGAHALAVGLDAPINIRIEGSTGYYCAGMNKKALIRVIGSVGPGAAENMMSGKLIVEGDASQYAGATGHGGTLIIEHGYQQQNDVEAIFKRNKFSKIINLKDLQSLPRITIGTLEK